MKLLLSKIRWDGTLVRLKSQINVSKPLTRQSKAEKKIFPRTCFNAQIGNLFVHFDHLTMNKGFVQAEKGVLRWQKKDFIRHSNMYAFIGRLFTLPRDFQLMDRFWFSQMAWRYQLHTSSPNFFRGVLGRKWKSPWKIFGAQKKGFPNFSPAAGFFRRGGTENR